MAGREKSGVASCAAGLASCRGAGRGVTGPSLRLIELPSSVSHRFIDRGCPGAHSVSVPRPPLATWCIATSSYGLRSLLDSIASRYAVAGPVGSIRRGEIRESVWSRSPDRVTEQHFRNVAQECALRHISYIGTKTGRGTRGHRPPPPHTALGTRRTAPEEDAHTIPNNDSAGTTVWAHRRTGRFNRAPAIPGRPLFSQLTGLVTCAVASGAIREPALPQ